MSGALVVRPEQLRALAAPVGMVAFVVHELSGHLVPVGDTGSPELTAAVDDLAGAWRSALVVHTAAVREVAAALVASAETYEAVDAIVAGWTGR